MKKSILEMKKNNPRRYMIEGEGQWGVSEGLIYDNFVVQPFNTEDIKGKYVYGLDFGFQHPTALISSIINEKDKTIYVYDEEYKTGMTQDDIEEMLLRKGYKDKIIICDNARPEIIEQLKKHGFKTKPCKKGKDSVLTGIQRLQSYKIVVHPCCNNLIAELYTYSWDTDKKTGKYIDKPVKEFDDACDALRYSLQGLNNYGGKVKFYKI